MRECFFSHKLPRADQSTVGAASALSGRIAAICARRAIALVAPRTPPRAVVHAARFRLPPPPRVTMHAAFTCATRPRARLPRSRLARRSIVRRPARRRPSPAARAARSAAPRPRRVRRADGREGRQGGDSLRRDSTTASSSTVRERGEPIAFTVGGGMMIPGSTTASSHIAEVDQVAQVPRGRLRRGQRGERQEGLKAESSTPSARSTRSSARSSWSARA